MPVYRVQAEARQAKAATTRRPAVTALPKLDAEIIAGRHRAHWLAGAAAQGRSYTLTKVGDREAFSLRAFFTMVRKALWT